MSHESEQIECAHSSITCLKCGYNLNGLAELRCPECGLSFDPQTREAFAQARISRIARLMTLLAIMGLGAPFVALWIKPSNYPIYNPGRPADEMMRLQLFIARVVFWSGPICNLAVCFCGVLSWRTRWWMRSYLIIASVLTALFSLLSCTYF
jgi:Zn-dependent protease